MWSGILKEMSGWMRWGLNLFLMSATKPLLLNFPTDSTSLLACSLTLNSVMALAHNLVAHTLLAKLAQALEIPSSSALHSSVC